MLIIGLNTTIVAPKDTPGPLERIDPVTQKKIIWLVQSNQTTPIICGFLQALRTRMERHLDLEFWMPDNAAADLEKIKGLSPVVCKTRVRTASQSSQAFAAKKETLKNGTFSQGLNIADVLILDDLGGGNIQMTAIEDPPPENVAGLMLQIPSPMGSSEVEEKNFHAAILWARQHRIRVIGYELLPLDTQWTLAPSLPDGVITRYPESYAHLASQLRHNNIWLLPTYEGAVFSSVATSFHLNGAKASYDHRNRHNIHGSRTVLFIPHNVAMIYDYKALLEILSPQGKTLHLMFCVGRDQVRGGYSHEQMIKTVCEKELEKFASFSFHDVNNTWETMMADALVACSSCMSTMVAEKELPCIIYDPKVPETVRGNKIRVGTPEGLSARVRDLVNAHRAKKELADILMFLASSGENHG